MTPTRASILIVDDDIQNRRLLEALLMPEGYLTHSAASGEEALAQVAREAPDLILLDVMMPGMDGYQVAGLLKANPVTQHIPIIMVTAHTDRSARLAGLNAGAEEFLTKPVDRAELWVRVRNLLRLKVLGDFLKNHAVILEQEVQARTIDLQRFRTAMDATADAIFLSSCKTMRFIEVNATACSMLGYAREELLTIGPQQLASDASMHADLLRAGPLSHDGVAPLVEMEVRRKDGSVMQVELSRQIQRTGDDWIIVGVMHDITERKEAARRLHHMAHYDALTGLPNRTLFFDTLKKALMHAADNDWLVAVLFIDLDNFKSVNDTLGHSVGDELLSQVSNRLVQCVRIRDTVGRLGGDEFAVILMMQNDQQNAWLVTKKVRDALRPAFALDGHTVSITASIGITIHPDDASDPESLLKYADTAMYQAKQAGRDTYRFFTAQMNVDVLARIELETALRQAIENEEFVLHYQPKVQLSSGRVTGLEALLRWQRPGHGLVSPGIFIPVLEETGLIVSVGSWVISNACKQIGAWMRSDIGPMQVSVNVAGRQFVEGNLDADVCQALTNNDIPANLLELELTEGSLMANTERTIACLHELRNQGVQISIDDFGTGYSSLAYLRRFPIDKLKIDIAFIRDITNNPDDAAIALAIISMAHSLKMEVIAEGVETEGQLAYLRRHRCDHIQGYYFSPPLSVAKLEEMFREDRRLSLPPGESGERRQTLLLVDDEDHVVAALKRLLRPDGYQILVAKSAAEGFELLAKHAVQVILCDQRMPTRGGTVFLDRAKEMYPDTLRIVLSGYTDLASIMDAINCGAIHRFYTKPWDNTILRGNIREAFHHHSLLHDVPQQDGAAPPTHDYTNDRTERRTGKTHAPITGNSSLSLKNPLG